MHRVEYLLDYFKDELDISRLSFILLNNQHSFDQDIYIVTSEDISFFRLWQHEGIWYEVFVDSEKVLNNKLNNQDEIIINFMNQFTFYYGDTEKYQAAHVLAESALNNYCMSQMKKRKVQYRIKVLSSKMTGDVMNDSFVMSSMVYPIAQLLLDKAGVMQCSPKFWTRLIEEKCDAYYFSLFAKVLQSSASESELNELIHYVCDDFAGISITYDGDNDSTFVC